MKIRLTCSFSGCLNDDFATPAGSSAVSPAHRVIEPGMIGFNFETGWTLDALLALGCDGLARLARRSLETAGVVDAVDFQISLPGSWLPRPHSLAEDLLLFITRMETAFADHAPLDWLLVSLAPAWLERLHEYQRLKTGNVVSSPEFPTAELREQLLERGIVLVEAMPEEIPAIRARRFPDSAMADADGGFAACTDDAALLVTADERLFAAWKELHSSPSAAHLPVGWESCLGKYWHLLPLVSKHLAVHS